MLCETIAANLDMFIFDMGHNRSVIDGYFDANNKLKTILRLTGKETQTDIVCDTMPQM